MPKKEKDEKFSKKCKEVVKNEHVQAHAAVIGDKLCKEFDLDKSANAKACQ